MDTNPWRKLWKLERGFTLIEAIAALLILGTIVVGSLGVMALTARTSARAEESVTLLQLVRAQIETIQQSPFQQSATNYPTITGIPDGFTVTFSATEVAPEI